MIAAAVRSGIGAGVAALLACTPSLLHAQSAPDDRTAAAIAAWTHLDAPTGVEELAHPALQRVLGAGWNADRMGNLVKRVGSGSPRRVIACAMDVGSFTVSAITDDGYNRLHRAGTPSHPLWDQFHEAQPVRVLTTRGSVNGVVAIANGHFSRQHRGDTAVVDVDMLWVDVGASTRAEAEARGITLLDPVVAERPAWTIGDYATGPAAGARAGCAAVSTAGNAARADAPGERVFVLSSQRAFGWVGLAGVLARIGPVDELALFDAGVAGRAGRSSSSTVPASRLGAGLRALTRVVHVGRDSVATVHTDGAASRLARRVRQRRRSARAAGGRGAPRGRCGRCGRCAEDCLHRAGARYRAHACPAQRCVRVHRADLRLAGGPGRRAGP
jgi:putative aminopeptidase FrvX